MAEHLTLMAVHAHPDDEALGTGGTLARYAREGVRVVLVTCTGGELGDMPGGTKPDEAGHDPASVVALRRAELAEAARILGVSHLELLGYRDSGMMGWPQNEAPDAFWNVPVEEAAARVATLVERYRPQVVVTYDANGFYGHPDHIQAHRVTHAAAERTGIPRKLYHTAVGREQVRWLRDALLAAGATEEEWDFDPEDPPIGIPDHEITTTIDVTDVLDLKRAAIAAHASQKENLFPLRLPDELFRAAFGRESYVRAVDTTGAPLPEDDLFAGLR
jgi:N-acetyl-1-D-myo-inositol-2-amino-2-deoxy-alpha-D-glucopyranoside deacetylase